MLSSKHISHQHTDEQTFVLPGWSQFFRYIWSRLRPLSIRLLGAYSAFLISNIADCTIKSTYHWQEIISNIADCTIKSTYHWQKIISNIVDCTIKSTYHRQKIYICAITLQCPTILHIIYYVMVAK